MAKRLFDLVVAALGLLLLSPLLLAVALWVRLDSPGPALYRQERVGRFGRLFRIHKFRTMSQDRSTDSIQIGRPFFRGVPFISPRKSSHTEKGVGCGCSSCASAKVTPRRRASTKGKKRPEGGCRLGMNAEQSGPLLG